ncbi:MAG: hypothetical protein FWG30_09865 [Eubacteriaceae bacterium]|jgi:hypothetical protein|nr:hypothetical protein [Eubacteriaceae bacterium]
MRNLWNKKFAPNSDVNYPDEILRAQCSYLYEITNGKVIGKVQSYNGPISSSISKSLISTFTELVPIEGIEAEIQDSLGNVSKSDFTYEFFITSISTPNYKYRVLFIHYELPFYPVSVVLDEGICSELGLAQSFLCKSQEEFEDALERILNSSKLESIISSLLMIVGNEELVPPF